LASAGIWPVFIQPVTRIGMCEGVMSKQLLPAVAAPGPWAGLHVSMQAGQFGNPRARVSGQPRGVS